MALRSQTQVRRHAPTIAAAGLAVSGAAVLLVAGRGTWFYLDEWDFSLRAAHLSVDSVMGPNNQNWHGTVVLLYRAMFELFGFHYVPFRLLAIGLVVAIALLGYVYARRRVGPWWALLPLALLVASPSFEVQLWPFQIGQLLSGAAGLGALLLLDRDPTRANRVAAGALLVVAVASSSAGLPLVALVVYDRLLTRGRRAEALVALPAIVAYAIWSAEWGSREPRPNKLTADSLNAAVDRAYDIGGGVMQALLGLGSQGAKGALLSEIALVALGIAVCWRVFGPYSSGRGRVIALGGGLVTYWVLLAWGRAFQAGIEVSGRYLFLSQVIVVLLLVEVGAGIGAWLRDESARGRRAARPARVGLGVAVAVVAALAAVHNARTELDFGETLRQNARAMRGQVYGLSLLEEQSRAAAPIFLEPLGPQIQRSAGPYFDLFKRFGGPSPTENDVRELPPDGRARADLAIFIPSVLPQPDPDSLRFGGAAPEATALGGARPRLREAGSCVTVRSTQAGRAVLEVRLPPAGMAVAGLGETPLTVRGRRYAADWNGPSKVDVGARSWVTVAFPADRGTAPWRVRVAGDGRLCSLG
jgi:hypothetical protein